MELRFFNGGHCRQLLGLIDRRTWKWARFHAVFLAVRHPREGWVLVDTGYGARFPGATARWPYRLYRWATPAVMAGTAAQTLRRAGIDPTAVRHVVVTHFHADHVGGLRDFPDARIHFSAEAWRLPAALSPLRQVRSAFLPSLTPENLDHSGHALEKGAFAVSPDLPFPSHDLFGDGLLHLIELPGHAAGHLGVVFPEAAGQPLIYAADAFWHSDQIDRSTELMAPALAVQWDSHAYRQTVGQLRRVAREGRYRILACHDPATQFLIGSAS